MNIRILFFSCFMTVGMVDAAEPKKVELTPEQIEQVEIRLHQILLADECNEENQALYLYKAIAAMLQKEGRSREAQELKAQESQQLLKNMRCHELSRVYMRGVSSLNASREEVFIVNIGDLSPEQRALLVQRIQAVRRGSMYVVR